MGAIGDVFGGVFGGGDDSGDAAIKGSQIQADAQREALAYLKEREALPQEFRESALKSLGGAFGVPGGMSGQEFMSNAEASPVYQALLGDRGAQEEAILRNQSATGTRTGATEAMLAQNEIDRRSRALGGTIQGIQGMANLPSLAPAIASNITGIGTTLGQGVIGAEQSRQAGQQAGFGNMLGLGQLGLSAYSAFCDPRLKEGAACIGEIDGIRIYKWMWNKEAEDLGLVGEGTGPMADEIQRFFPERVTKRNGYLFVRAA